MPLVDLLDKYDPGDKLCVDLVSIMCKTQLATSRGAARWMAAVECYASAAVAPSSVVADGCGGGGGGGGARSGGRGGGRGSGSAVRCRAPPANPAPSNESAVGRESVAHRVRRCEACAS